MTSIGTGDSKDAPPGQVYDVLKPVLLEKEKAEEALKVRPCCDPLHIMDLLGIPALRSPQETDYLAIGFVKQLGS